MSQSVDTVTLTTPDITNTVTTPGLIDIMTKNGMVVSEQGHNIAVSEAEQQFNQFSLQSQQLQSGMVMTAPQTITTQIEHSPQTVQYATSQPTIKREPADERNYVEMDTVTIQQQHYQQQQQQHQQPMAHQVQQKMDNLSVIPVNMDDQKLERKRERNRLAATKCRQRKIQKINVLEVEVQNLTERNNNLKSEREHLREEIKRLEQQYSMNAMYAVTN